jgi:hypothetical protein
VTEGTQKFYAGADPVQGVATVPREPPELPMLVLVVDDSDDDELVAAMAEADEVPAVGYDGLWDALDTGDHHTLKFRLVRMADAWERAWTYIDPPRDMVETITAEAHHVAILPREFAGDLGNFDPRSLAGAVIVEVAVGEPGAAALRALSGY